MSTRTDRIRRPAVSGSFYPDDPDTLRETVRTLLAEAGQPASPRRPKALVAPHAGYMYSGAVAATGFQTLAPFAESIRRVVILGPSHHHAFAGLALPTATAMATPLGIVPVDLKLSRRILELAQVEVLDLAHVREHALEVELPFLQVLLPDAQCLPLVVGRASAEQVAEVLAAVWGEDETLILVSSDLSHYLGYDEAAAEDRATADAILALDPSLEGHQACGAAPLNGLLQEARKRGLEAGLLDLRSSGDAGANRDRVVGYGAFAFYRPA